ncbi:MAG: hypothetical protein JSW58_10965 [Candidatus Latescibacterota bacterium]|nr:MAG: hypothetical protein JSW58_10965 [Candidatus Latescibacterota bacterium]
MRVAKIVMLPVVCMLIFASGCVYDELASEVVVTEKVVVQFKEHRVSPDINSAVVCDRFRQRLLGILDDHGATLDDIVSITMVSGQYKVAKPAKDKSIDWTVAGDVTVARQDDPSGPVTEGPETFVNFTTQPLQPAKSTPIYADLNSAGVTVINNALEDLRNGGDPRLVLNMGSDNITPAPSPSNPLDFSWLAMVTFQVVIDMDKTE